MFDTLSPRKIQENLKTSARQAWLASLGAVASIEEEGSQLIDQLVERGREFESRRLSQVEEKIEAAGDEVESIVDQVGSIIDQRVAASLKQVGLPTRTQVRELTRRVERLADLVDRLEVEPELPAADERKVYHVTPHEEGWKVQAEGAERANRLTDTKAEAVAAARELAKNQEPSQVVIHRQDGTIQTHYTYGEMEEDAS